MTGIAYLPLSFPVQPFAYAGVGRSFWNYDVVIPQGTAADSSSDFYWHAGVGGEIMVGENLRVRIGYRYWLVEMHPEAGKWAVSPDRYSYRRRGVDVAVHWFR